MKTVLLVLLLALIKGSAALAQTSPIDTTNGRPYYILLKDGSHIQGRIIRQDSTIYTVRMKNGQLTYVEKELFDKISAFAPAPVDSVAYFTAQTYSQPSRNQPRPAEVSPNRYDITLADGTRLNASVLSQDSTRLVVRTEALGTVYIPARQVVRMERVTLSSQTMPRSAASTGNPNLFPQYMNFLPTAYQAEKGRVYFRNTFIYISQFDVGITDNWSIGATFFTFVPTLFGSLSTKVSVPLGPRIRVGVQAQLLYGGLFDRATSTGLFQGIVSIGDAQNNVTVGLGTGTNADSFGQIASVGVVRKIKPSLTFISENLLFIERYGVSFGKLSAGLRFDRVRHSFDLSANIPFGPEGITSSATLFIIPSASYQVRIGR